MARFILGVEFMERYFSELTAAFVRGRLGDPRASIEDGQASGLRLHKFKAGGTLPRVRRVIGILRELQPECLLDIGSGRGAFLWPLLAALPEVRVTAVEVNGQHVSDIQSVRRGGVDRLTAVQMDAQRMALAPGSFDVVTMLEVLEHLEDPLNALRNAVAVARRFVVLSVPSVPDNNPEHLHLFSVEQLQRMAVEAGGRRPTIEHVLNHRIAVVRTGGGVAA